MVKKLENYELVKVAEAFLPTKYGDFKMMAFWSRKEQTHHLALVAGDVANQKDILVRVHSSCVTGDIFASQRCDCREQLLKSLDIIGQKRQGVILYLFQEGRGIGLVNKLLAMRLQESGLDTVEANLALQQPSDAREYDTAAKILKHLKVKSIELLSNNLDKVKSLEEQGIKITVQRPLLVRKNKHNSHYLYTKKMKLGHLINI